MMVAFMIAIGATFSLPVNRFSEERERLVLLLAGCAVISLVMLVDDAVGLQPWAKLAWQVGVALLVVLPRARGVTHGIVLDRFNTPFFGQVTLPVAVAMLFTLFWIVGMMNTLNWVDGLDGLAGSVTLVTCVVLFLHTYFWPRDNPQFTVSFLPLALAGVVIGFLP